VPISGTPAAWWSCSPEQSANRSTGSFCLGSPVTLGSFLSECWQRTARTHRITSVSLLSPVGFAPAARITVAQPHMQRSRSTGSAVVPAAGGEPLAQENGTRRDRIALLTRARKERRKPGAMSWSRHLTSRSDVSAISSHRFGRRGLLPHRAVV
jgi:hypothetical protein